MKSLRAIKRVIYLGQIVGRAIVIKNKNNKNKSKEIENEYYGCHSDNFMGAIENLY